MIHSLLMSHWLLAVLFWLAVSVIGVPLLFLIGYAIRYWHEK